jgi:RND family efflux transporter MFP subunit
MRDEAFRQAKDVPMVSLFRAALGAAALAFVAAMPLSAHEGHGDASPTLPLPSLAPRAEAASDLLELVAVAQGGELVFYLDRFATNEPVEDAAIEVETPAGPASAQARPGEPYRLAAPWSANPGSYDLIVSVAKDGMADVLPLRLVIPPANASGASVAPGVVGRAAGGLWIGAGSALAGIVAGFAIGGLLRRRRHGAAAMLMIGATLAMSGDMARAQDNGAAAIGIAVRDLAHRLPDGTVVMPKSTQRILAVRTAITEAAAHRRAVELPGRIIPDPNTSGYVQAAVGGRLSPPPGGFPRLGTPVKKGDVLAYLEAPLQAIDVSDMRQRQGELDQQISIVDRRLARYETLVVGGAVTRTQLEETRLELQGLQARRAALDKVRREPEALVAPVAGVIAEGTPVAGQIAQSNAVIFNIVDPSCLWVEALAFDPLTEVQSATARLNSERSYPLTFKGAGFAGRNQSIPVQFAVEGDVSGLRAGQFVTVLVTTREEKTGLAIPRASVVRSANGQDVVYEHVAAERFEPRVVRIEPLDGERVFVASGLAAGKRIVVQGAELLGQVR